MSKPNCRAKAETERDYGRKKHAADWDAHADAIRQERERADTERAARERAEQLVNTALEAMGLTELDDEDLQSLTGAAADNYDWPDLPEDQKQDWRASVRAALAAADKAAWRPISEAPKDGTPVLTKVEDETESHEPAVSRWFSLDLLRGNKTIGHLPEWRDGVWLTVDPEDFDSDQALAEYICGGDYQPTHFMWLPR